MNTPKANYATCLHRYTVLASSQYKGSEGCLLCCVRTAYKPLATVL